MPLTDQNITDIRASWTALSMDPDSLTQTFYAELFRLAPEVKPLFGHSDMRSQRRKLAAAIGTVVHHADNLAPVVPVLHEMGSRHVRYGATEAHYDVVGQALIHAIGTVLGASFTDAVRDAWVLAYTAVASTMLAGAAATLRKSA